MKAPQIIILSLMGLEIILTSYYHGKTKKGNYNVFTTIISSAITIAILYWGGFFK